MTDRGSYSGYGGFSSSTLCMLDFFSDIREHHFTGLFQVLGPDVLSKITEIFATDPYEYRKGWPDLTLWKGEKVVFKEVKAPGDRLHKSQRKTISEVLIPLGFEVTIVDVVPSS
ncbi:MAG: VRR-NUC domain-containing protein [Alphaproteobacteria bacterium]